MRKRRTKISPHDAASLLHYVTRESLRELADEPSYSRGVTYAEENRVSALTVEASRAKATVLGSQPYHVELWIEHEELNYSCSCPLFLTEMVFCKHCVALGFALLSGRTGTDLQAAGADGASPRELSMEQVRAFLESEDKATLVDLLLDHAEDNDRLKS